MLRQTHLVVGIILGLLVLNLFANFCLSNLNSQSVITTTTRCPVPKKEAMTNISSEESKDNQVEAPSTTPASNPDIRVVLYYATWCGICKNFAPEWDKFEERCQSDSELASVKPIKKLCEGDAVQTCSANGVQGYPTIIAYRKMDDGRYEASFFNDNRTCDNIVSFVKSKL